MMRKVKYYIDDFQWFKRFYNLSDTAVSHIFGNNKTFKVVFTLFGESNDVNRYELTDYKGDKVLLDSLNDYQIGVTLRDCYAHFEGGKYFDNQQEPTGVVKIEEVTLEKECCGK